MEILIIGGIIVALMVYVSTRIKKVSKLAYEREVFDTAEFSIIKPDEFIIPVDENSPFVFEARSRDLGEDEASDFYQCLATIQVQDGAEKAQSFETQKTEKDVLFDVFHKTVPDSAGNKIYELEIAVLPEFKEKYRSALDEMLNSFTVK
jgi:hypothetical protein